MNYAERNAVVDRIISGTFRCRIGSTVYTVKAPDKDTRYAAQELYDETLYESMFAGWIDTAFISDILVKNELLSREHEKNIKEIEKRIDELKIQLFQNLFSFKKQQEIRKLLVQVRAKHSQMLSIKHMFDSCTPEGFAAIVRDEFLLANSIYKDSQLMWPDLSKVNYYLFNDIVSCINQNNLSVTTFRELARTEPWRSYWSVGKPNVFDRKVTDWTEEQRTLAGFSRMYDNVFESTEFPGDEVVDDDDMLDGWMLLARLDREKMLNDKNVDKLLVGGTKNEATEVFIPAKNKEQADKINNMNTTQGRMIKKEREAQIKARGGVKHGDLRDQRLEVHQLAIEQYKQHTKGK